MIKNHLYILIMQIFSLIIKIRVGILGIIILFFTANMYFYHPKLQYDQLYTITEGSSLLIGLIFIDYALPRRFKLKIKSMI